MSCRFRPGRAAAGGGGVTVVSVTEALQDEVAMLWSDEGRLATLSAALVALADALGLGDRGCRGCAVGRGL